MCNAWNHSPGCTCGWGGSGSTGGGNFGGRSYSLETPSSQHNTLSDSLFIKLIRKRNNNNYENISEKDFPGRYSKDSDSSRFDSLGTESHNKERTYQTKCWYCGDEVFYHTNGFGDCVLFDELGHPWQVHECWINYCE